MSPPSRSQRWVQIGESVFLSPPGRRPAARCAPATLHCTRRAHCASRYATCPRACSTPNPRAVHFAVEPPGRRVGRSARCSRASAPFDGASKTIDLPELVAYRTRAGLPAQKEYFSSLSRHPCRRPTATPAGSTMRSSGSTRATRGSTAIGRLVSTKTRWSSIVKKSANRSGWSCAP